ncbi:MAG: hypothetical protein GF308_12660 [Candidatus Heimdallarchaeota archaeon]|nr:hypothetical protein [Candidatus Heimdallarchaeota archaeon]
MNDDDNLNEYDPLVLFRCRNPQCRQTFTPSTYMNVSEHLVHFICPICGSKYEAQYADVEGFPGKEVIMLIEPPRMIYKGTRIASS